MEIDLLFKIAAIGIIVAVLNQVLTRAGRDDQAMMTRKELHDEFWLLTRSVLQDSKVDTNEAKVLKRWLEEHQIEGEFNALIEKLAGFLVDGYVDRFESSAIVNMLGRALAQLNQG